MQTERLPRHLLQKSHYRLAFVVNRDNDGQRVILWQGLALREFGKLFGVVTGWCSGSSFGDQINSKDQKLRIDRMPIAQLRKAYIVNHGIEDQQSRKQEHSVNVPLPCQQQSPDGQHGRCQEEQILGCNQSRDVRDSRHTVPEKNEAPEGQHQETAGMLFDPFPCQTALFRGKRSLAHLFVLCVLIDAISRMVREHIDPLRQRVIADPQFDSEIVADEYRPAECLIIAYQPWHDRHPENNGA